MTVKIFVGRIAEGTTSSDIRILFEKYGAVKECDVVSSFGFVHMESEKEATEAIAAIDGELVNGSCIQVEISNASTQGRKKKADSFRFNGRGGFNSRDNYVPPGGGLRRYEPYHQRLPSLDVIPHMDIQPIRSHTGFMLSKPMPPPPKEEHASEQVKDLLELYFRDPHAFDQYAKTYYYGERYERLAAIAEQNQIGYLGGSPSSDRRPRG